MQSRTSSVTSQRDHAPGGEVLVGLTSEDSMPAPPMRNPRNACTGSESNRSGRKGREQGDGEEAEPKERWKYRRWRMEKRSMWRNAWGYLRSRWAARWLILGKREGRQEGT